MGGTEGGRAWPRPSSKPWGGPGDHSHEGPTGTTSRGSQGNRVRGMVRSSPRSRCSAGAGGSPTAARRVGSSQAPGHPRRAEGKVAAGPREQLRVAGTCPGCQPRGPGRSCASWSRNSCHTSTSMEGKEEGGPGRWGGNRSQDLSEAPAAAQQRSGAEGRHSLSHSSERSESHCLLPDQGGSRTLRLLASHYVLQRSHW